MSKFIKFKESFINKYRNIQPNWGYNGLGYIVYKRTYSRIKENGETEEWFETVQRCIEGAQKIGAEYTEAEAEQLFDHVFNLRCSFAGRMLWQLGTSTVDRFGANSLLNCWFTAVREPEAFLFIFENLMLGGGVGFSIKREDIHELPRVKKGIIIEHNLVKDADFIVPDSREGWVALLRMVLEAFYNGGKSFTYSTILVRGAGEVINGFGGTASGPQILISGIEKIVKIFQSREGKKLRSLDVLDICNIIGSIVVAGNVRKSAEIALGDPDDYLFLRAKNWTVGAIPNWRSMSNNTIYADSFDQISDEVWKNGYEIHDDQAKGEPYGFFNLPLAQSYGRLKDKPVRDNCEGLNPCGEITLSNYECCNLSELFLNNITSKEQLIECATLLYKTQKAISKMPFLNEETNKIVHKNMRLGLGVGGICQSLDKVDWLDDCYVALREYDKQWSKYLGVPESIKLTTVKPSGTISLLSGSLPGVHPAYSRYYIRRVRMAAEDKLVKTCREMGYHVEFVKNFDGTDKHDTVVVEFPCETASNAILAKDMGVIKQLELVKLIQEVWADNAVSVTAYYSPEELDDLKSWMAKNYQKSVKSVSFLLRNKHGFCQAPYEEVSQEVFLEISKGVKPLGTIKVEEGAMLEGVECAGGVCPIR
jgi:ribonucleoside-triphosphate reductase